jgi:limonene-1,2-epoxide hydrolase
MGHVQEHVVLRLFETLASSSATDDDVLALFTDDASYKTNAWHEPHVGKNAIRAELERQSQLFEDLRSEVLLLLSDDNHVLVERLDHMTIGGKRCTLHFAGAFDVTGGRISGWRDHYDMDEVRSAASP